jgi:hypothetical protein
MEHDLWREQYCRVIRWRSRALSVLTSNPDPTGHLLQDFLFAFFINCYHLTDWLDQCLGVGAGEFAKENVYLETCRGICNGVKHLKLDQERFKYTSHYHRISLTGPAFDLPLSSTGGTTWKGRLQPEAKVSIDCSVSTEQDDFEARFLVDKCVEAWDSFIKDHSLHLPQCPGGLT